MGASATWSKVKYQSHQYTSKLTPSTKQSSTISNNKFDKSNGKIIEFGYNGEIFIAYNNNTVEVWDWIPSALELNELENTSTTKQTRKTKSNILLDDEFNSNDTLYLVASLFDIKGSILNINPIKCDQKKNTYTVLITSILGSETIFTLKSFGQLFEEQVEMENLILPPCVHGLYPFTIKNSSTFIGIATNEGSLTIFDAMKRHPLSLPLDVAIIDDQAMFTISGRYLAYIPSFANQDPDQLTENGDELIKTPLIVPSNNEHSIYSKILNNLSTTAIDGVGKLSELNVLIQKNLYDISSNTIKANIKSYLSSLINGFKQLNQYVIIYDLIKETKIGCFQPPNGCSNLSLSTFNTQLVTINQRGDQLYNWDISKLPKEISLIDIQTRGKTSSIVDEIFWSTQNSIDIITRSSGSIHSFKDNSTNNWVLSNMGCSKLTTTSTKKHLVSYCKDGSIYLIDLKTGTTSTNFKLPKTSIPKSLLPNHIKLHTVDEIVMRTSSVHEDDDDYEKNSTVFLNNDTPLSQVEIETCSMTAPLYTNTKIQLGTYDLGLKSSKSGTAPVPLDDCVSKNRKPTTVDTSDREYFRDVYENPGNFIGFKQINFGKGSGMPVFNYDVTGGGEIFNHQDKLMEAINDVLIVDK